MTVLDVSALEAFAQEVGSSGPVAVEGGRTHWDLGGHLDAGTRLVHAPAGVVAHEPAEMVVRVRAGTTVAELLAVTETAGQMVPVDVAQPWRSTVGGALMVGRSGVRRLRYGPLRDTVLEARYVSAEGKLIRAGGPVVKNVTGFDLCRLLVGSLGTLGLLAEVVLRCLPVPPASQWWRGSSDPFALYRRLYRPSSILWDGTTTWVLLEGDVTDVADQAAQVLGNGFEPVDGPPVLPGDARWSWKPGELVELPRRVEDGGWVAEVGVGTVHVSNRALRSLSSGGPVLSDRAWRAPVSPRLAELHRSIKERFDPTGRLNPGRQVL